MTVKMIAVDMDGTFLNSQQDYDRKRFAKQFEKMKELGVHFVVASGNQYAQLASFFPDIIDEISFVAENGAYVKAEGELLFAASIPRSTLEKALTVMETHDNFHGLLCGVKRSYCQADVNPIFYQYASQYYFDLETVPDLRKVEDVFLKFALNCPAGDVAESMAILENALEGELIPVSSGHGDIDLILPGVHKASGIERLQQHFGISQKEVAAFGDSGNDLEMIQHANYSYAMANGAENVKKAAKVVLGDHNTTDLLDTIDQLLAEKAAENK